MNPRVRESIFEMKTLWMTAAAAAMVLPLAAQAQDSWVRDGAYGRVEGGWSNLDDNDFNTSAGRVSTKYKDDGWMAGAALGKRMGPWRAELEGLHQENTAKTVELNGANPGGGDGHAKLNALMANGYYDFGNGRFKPYIGGGVGAANVKMDKIRNNVGQFADDDDNVLAYQGMAGVSYELNPCWSINAEYRYLGTNDADIKTLGGGTQKVGYDTNNVLIGATYKF